ncbi:MAG: thiolase [Burkholderiales bacterium RIFCSPHIGHO2_12_FULL_69_20]|nr:MAG: thiolase [Burkholderiales bacterium RIFCSPHIGHO2_12_FULL_69_20]
MRAAHLIGVGLTPFGRHEGASALDLMARAAQSALDDAGLERGQVDGLLCGYATTLPHLMLATLFAERFALQPRYAHSMQLGGATGAALLMLAGDLVRSGRCQRVLVVAGENRLSGQHRDNAIQTLAQVGDAQTEVPNGGSVPAYYALMASRYLHETGTTEADLAELAVLMRRHAGAHPGAQLRSPLTVADVLASKPIATPLKLADCCPISDGAAALLVSAQPGSGPRVVLRGAGQAHRHQHLSAMDSVLACGAGEAAQRALLEAGLRLEQIDHLAIYDSFTITLAMLLEEIGFAARGGSAARARAGDFGPQGALPLNLHGGLLSYGHCGVAGGMAHAVEAVTQLAGRAGARQVPRAQHALVHADGGVMSSHVSLVLLREG